MSERKELTQIPKQYGIEDRTYRLKRKSTPLSYILPSRNTHSCPLLHYDEKIRTQRALRYSSNQRTPFEDEQDDHAIIRPVEFVDGFLRVGKEEVILQWFLDIHPLNGKTFEKVDSAREAVDELARLDLESDAETLIREMSTDERRNLALIIFASKSKNWKNEEVSLQLRKFAKSKPKEILKLAENPAIENKSLVHRFFEKRLIVLKNGDQLFIKTPQLEEKILDMPKKSDRTKQEHLEEFLNTPEGQPFMAILENALNEKMQRA